MGGMKMRWRPLLLAGILIPLLATGVWLCLAPSVSGRLEGPATIPLAPGAERATPPAAPALDAGGQQRPNAPPAPPPAALASAIEQQRLRLFAAQEAFDAAEAEMHEAEFDLERYRELDERRWISRYTLQEAEAWAAESRDRAVHARLALDREEGALAALLRSANGAGAAPPDKAGSISARNQ